MDIEGVFASSIDMESLVASAELAENMSFALDVVYWEMKRCGGASCSSSVAYSLLEPSQLVTAKNSAHHERQKYWKQVGVVVLPPTRVDVDLKFSHVSHTSQ